MQRRSFRRSRITRHAAPTESIVQPSSRRRSRVHLDRLAVRSALRQSKHALLQPFEVDNETAAIPKEDLAAVAATADENEQVPSEEVHLPLRTDDCPETLEALPKIDRLRREIDPDARWKRQHERSARTSSATYATSASAGTRTTTPSTSSSTSALRRA